MVKMSKKQKQAQKQVDSTPSAINKSMIRSLAQVYDELPGNAFGKLTVTLCMFCSILAIVVSFIFLYFGIDSSSILIASLGFFGSELLFLCVRAVLNREQTKDDILFELIRNNLNDGKFYDSQGKVVYTETDSEGNIFIDNSVHTVNNTTNNDTVNGDIDRDNIDNCDINGDISGNFDDENNNWGSLNQNGAD